MKTCTRCKVDQPQTNFRKKARSKDGLHPWCKGCCKESEAATYANNPERRKAIRDNTNTMRQANREYVWRYLEEHPCACGEADPRVLEFDHIDPSTKLEDVSELVSKSYSLQTIKDEISKCRVMCANCHRRHTYIQRGFWCPV